MLRVISHPIGSLSAGDSTRRAERGELVPGARAVRAPVQGDRPRAVDQYIDFFGEVRELPRGAREAAAAPRSCLRGERRAVTFAQEADLECHWR